MDSTQSLFKSAKNFFSGTLLSRVSGALRDIAMAYAFGTQETVASFFVAFRLAHLLRRLLGEGALQSAFVPKFEKLRAASEKRAAHFFTSLYAILFLLLIFLIAFCFLGCQAAERYQFLDKSFQEILSLTGYMMPSLLFICLWGLNCSLLQCEKRYFLSSASPIAFNVVWIMGAVLIKFFSPEHPQENSSEQAMIWLSFTIIGGSASQWLITLPSTWGILKQLGFKPLDLLLHKNWASGLLTNPDIKSLAKPLLLGILGVAAVQINSALDPLFAHYADGKGPAYLWYAIRIQQVPLALFGIALSSALLPPLARAIEQKDSAKYQSLFRYCFRRCIWMMVPATTVLLLFGKWGISLVYGHGNFSLESIEGTTACLSGYAWGLFPMACVLIYAPAFYARGNYFIPSMASLFSVVLNILLNGLFIFSLGLGAESVAYGTSLSAWGNFAILAWMMRRGEREEKAIVAF